MPFLGTGWSGLEAITAAGLPVPTGVAKMSFAFRVGVGATTRPVDLLPVTLIVEATVGTAVANGTILDSPLVSSAVFTY